MAMLEVDEVSVLFGGHMAVNQVDLSVEVGEVTGLIGPNGAGKTTLFNVITGLQAPTAGEVRLDGQNITGLSAHRRARRGVARTFQRLELFGSLTVEQNVLTAAELAKGSTQRPATVTSQLLDRVGLTDVASQRADALSTGNARLLELARALACRPRVLLLDEPASGLDDGESKRFADLLSELAADGLAILLVEHDVPLVMQLCRRITVLDLGSVLAVGTPEEIQADERVIAAYLGQGTDLKATP